MYYPVGWPKTLNLPNENDEPIQQVARNRERTLFAVITAQCIHIWQCKPCVLIASYRRSADSVVVLGTNVFIEWRPCSSAVAVSTSGGHLLIFRIHHVGNRRMYATIQSSSYHYKRDTTEADTIAVPFLKISYGSSILIPGGISCLCCLRDELIVSSKLGVLHRVTWDGVTRPMLDIILKSIPFSLDLQQSRESSLDDQRIYVTHVKYSQMLGDCAIVLSDGRAAVLTTENNKFVPKNVRAVWAPDVPNATCVAINNKFRLIAYGLKNGQGIVFCLDEITGALLVSHRLTLSTSDYPEGCRGAGAVTGLRWTPDGSVLLLTWKNGGFSLWSVFGSLLMTTLGSDYRSNSLGRGSISLHIQSMEWGPEGYSLWLTTVPKLRDSEDPNPHNWSNGHLLQLSFVKSALTTNPCMTNHEHLFLQGEDRLYLNSGDSLIQCNPEDASKSPKRQPLMPSSFGLFGESSSLMGSKHWSVIQIPQSYLDSNWPIKFAVVDKSGHCLAVAGRYGLAHCALYTKRWKLFGNVTQEKDMSVTGGLAWWRDFLICACYNHYENRDEIRLYPRMSNLDNAFAFITKIPFPVILLNVFKDYLITFCSDCHISLYHIERKDSPASEYMSRMLCLRAPSRGLSQNSAEFDDSVSTFLSAKAPSASIIRIQDLSLANFIQHPSCMVSLTLTSLRSETANPKERQRTKKVESLIINTAGRVLMLQRDRQLTPSSENHQLDRRKKEISFCAPVVLASAVECMWTTAESSQDKPHLMEALWLGCGAAGMKVWLPLFPQEGEKAHHSFLSKRIMLPFQLRIYPLAVLFEEAIVLGASTDTITYDAVTPRSDATITCPFLPFTTVERSTQVYLHHILRQLLRRNLGIHALQIASSCKNLPYFAHVLELMVHEVLEEEATASEPIPDALLPRVIAFIHEFPEYLETVVHCARKTEIALWPYLFASVGSPQQLFEHCLQSGSLHSAASYLLIIQNLEPPKVSRKHATLLLDAALEKCDWQLCRDILRFLRAIGPGDIDQARTPPPIPNPNFYSMGLTSPRTTKESRTTQRSRSLSGHSNSKGAEEKPESDKRSLTTQKSVPSQRLSEAEPTAEDFYMDSILNRHARKLLSALRIRDLGMFSAHVEFKLTTWLAKESTRSGKVEDFVAALKKLHTDFKWPYPDLADTKLANSQLKEIGPFGRLTIDVYEPRQNGLDVPEETDQSSEQDSGTSNVKNSASAPLLSTYRPPNLKIFHPQSVISETLTSDSKTQEIALQHPSTKGSDDTPSFDAFEPSENSSTLGDGELSFEDSFWNNSITRSELEQFYQEMARKGPPQSEKELRYMLQMMIDAGCLEWALLISVVLRDLNAISRVVNTVSFTSVPLEIMGRMREGLSYLELWADTECPGYKPLLVAAKPQTQVLTEVVENTTSPPSPRSPSSTSSDHSVGHPEIKRYASTSSTIGELVNGEDEVFGQDEQGEEVNEGACSVS